MDCWMHFTSDRVIVEEHFPFGKPIVMHRPEEFYDLFHIICTQNYGLSHHRERIINHLVESLVYMISDESQTEAFSEVMIGWLHSGSSKKYAYDTGKV
uniref:hypothetical protein n=1 Tax=Agathobacter sp. TaxID=2021311 RepID=UPI0040285485